MKKHQEQTLARRQEEMLYIPLEKTPEEQRVIRALSQIVLRLLLNEPDDKDLPVIA